MKLARMYSMTWLHTRQRNDALPAWHIRGYSCDGMSGDSRFNVTIINRRTAGRLNLPGAKMVEFDYCVEP